MSANVIVRTPRLEKGIAVINKLDVSKFQLLVFRVLKTLPCKEEKSFTQEEESKLQVSLNLDNEEVVHLLLETLQTILDQAAYFLIKPSSLSQQLSQLGMNADMVAALVQVWTSQAKGVVENLSQHTVVPCQLENVNWRLLLQMGSSTRSRLALPISVFEFAMKNDESKAEDNFFVEFNHKELLEVYNQLESIQSQLDSLR